MGVNQRLGVTPKRLKIHFCIHSYVSLTWASRMHDEQSMLFIILKHFLSFSTMLKHAQACICWSKYTTNVVHILRVTFCGGPQGSIYWVEIIFKSFFATKWRKHCEQEFWLFTMWFHHESWKNSIYWLYLSSLWEPNWKLCQHEQTITIVWLGIFH